MGHYSFQYILVLDCVLNPSDNMRYQLVLVVLFITDRSGGASLFILQELCAYRVISDPFPCIVWECCPLWIFKLIGEIWYFNSILICASAPYTTSLDVSSYTFSTSYFTSYSTTSAIEKSTSSTATVSTAISINNTLSEAAWWRVGRCIESWKHCRQVSGCFEKCGRVWWPTNVDLCLQLYVWWHNLVY